jgi:multimeric flavodoxin WrbA
MKILAINSSHRGNNGYTAFLINKLFEGATEAGAACEVITLAKLKINRCASCDLCHTRDHYLRCIYDGKDDVRDIFNKMAEADIIVFATPVYIFSMSGLMKTFLDRINSTSNSDDLRLSKSSLFFHHIDQAVCSKPFVVLVCCNNMEDETPKNILSYFRTYSKFMDASQVGTLIRKSGKISGYGIDTEKENNFPRIHDVYRAYIQAGRELAVSEKIIRRTQKRANRNILPIPLIAKFLMKFKFFKKRMFEIIKNKFMEE